MPRELTRCPKQGCDGVVDAEVEYDYDSGGNPVSPYPRVRHIYSCSNPNH
jgi:hypothetical protein